MRRIHQSDQRLDQMGKNGRYTARYLFSRSAADETGTRVGSFKETFQHMDDEVIKWLGLQVIKQGYPTLAEYVADILVDKYYEDTHGRKTDR